MAYLNFNQRLALLGIDERATERDIRRAYAAKLKQIDQEADPAGFQALNESYQVLLEWSRGRDAIEPNETNSASDPPAPSKDAHETSVSTEELEQGFAVPPALAQAEKIFNAMALEFASRPWEKRPSPLLEAKRLLASTMEHPALTNIEAKEYFEWCVARHLAQGWRRGNEWLFPAAIEVFLWEKEQQRLRRFNQVGAVLDAVLNEKFAFYQQDAPERREQFEVLRVMRVSNSPSSQFLFNNIERATFIAARFPNLLAILSNEENLRLWVQKYRGDAQTAHAQEREGGLIWIGTVLFVLALCAFFTIKQSFRDPVKASPESMAPPSKSAALKLPSAEEMKTKFSGAATQSGCLEARLIHVRARIRGLNHQELGPVYEKYVEKCEAAGFFRPAARATQPGR